jgi:hypothetical protein
VNQYLVLKMRDKYFKSEHVEMWIDDGIIYSIHPSNDVITLEIAKENVKQRLKLTDGKTYPMFSDIRNVVSVDKAAREYLAGGEAIEGLSAGALLIKTQFEKIMSTLWMMINKPPRPLKTFTDKDDAIRWLEQFKSHHLN